jgi:murein L,D-transpeptidase YcbB/YkuD
MKNKSFSQIKFNIAIASIAVIFVGAVVYVPVLFFESKNREVQVVYKNVPVPVFITTGIPATEENQNIVSLPDEDNSPVVMSPRTELTITKNLQMGDNDPEVKALQEFLNSRGFLVAESGPGSPGNETTLFGAGTKDAVIRFQEAYADILLAPVGLTAGTGIVGELTRNLINS